MNNDKGRTGAGGRQLLTTQLPECLNRFYRTASQSKQNALFVLNNYNEKKTFISYRLSLKMNFIRILKSMHGTPDHKHNNDYTENVIFLAFSSFFAFYSHRHCCRHRQ